MNTTMNSWLPQKTGNFLTGQATISFTRKAVLFEDLITLIVRSPFFLDIAPFHWVIGADVSRELTGLIFKGQKAEQPRNTLYILCESDNMRILFFNVAVCNSHALQIWNMSIYYCVCSPNKENILT